MGSTTKAAWYWDIIRELLAHIDNVGYAILGTVYKIFYAIATATIISGDVIRNFYSRIQLILGILMMFKLAMSILNIIINPDLVTDSKQGGTKIITRVVTALFMLLLVIPINLPLEEADRTNSGKALSLNSYIYDHGILFGFLYKFQDSMMRENIMGRLILGTTGGGTSSSENNDSNDLDRDFNDIDANNLSEVGRNIAAQVAKTFIRPNVKNESEPYCYTDASQVSADSDFNSSYDPDTNPCPNVRCPAEVYRSGYTDEALAASSVVRVINTKCKDSELNKKVYAFNYMPLVGLLSSAFMSVIIIGFTVDIAVRAIKLAVLRLIAPIPILSYVDPKSQKDGAFGNWTKSLISTYIDLFIRLAIIYFGAFLIQSLFSSGTFAGINSGNAFIDMLSTVVIIIGILIFMKQAPAFLKSALGIKGEPMSNIGLAGLFGGAAMAIGGGGAAGFALGMMQGVSGAEEAIKQGKGFSPFASWKTNRDQMAKIRTGDKDARGGVMGGMMDRALYRTRERRLGKMGLTYEAMETAKARAHAQQEAVQRAQLNRDLAYEQLKNAKIFSNPKSLPPIGEAPNKDDFMKTVQVPTGIANIDPYNPKKQHFKEEQVLDDDAYNAAMKEYNQRVSERQNQQSLWDTYIRAEQKLSTAQELSTKLDKNYKSISEVRGTYGTNSTTGGEFGGDTSRVRRREGDKRTQFDVNSNGEVSRLDDVGVDAIISETGSSPRSGGRGHRP